MDNMDPPVLSLIKISQKYFKQQKRAYTEAMKEQCGSSNILS